MLRLPSAAAVPICAYLCLFVYVWVDEWVAGWEGDEGSSHLVLSHRLAKLCIAVPHNLHLLAVCNYVFTSA